MNSTEYYSKSKELQIFFDFDFLFHFSFSLSLSHTHIPHTHKYIFSVRLFSLFSFFYFIRKSHRWYFVYFNQLFCSLFTAVVVIFVFGVVVVVIVIAFRAVDNVVTVCLYHWYLFMLFDFYYTISWLFFYFDFCFLSVSCTLLALTIQKNSEYYEKNETYWKGARNEIRKASRKNASNKNVYLINTIKQEKVKSIVIRVKCGPQEDTKTKGKGNRKK